MSQAAVASPRLNVKPLDTTASFRSMAYAALKRAIAEMDVYGHASSIRLDERQLSQDLAVSRTPIREAITLLESEGFVRSVPRRGIFVVRKTKREIVEMITVWAALESAAARLAIARASDADIGRLETIMAEFRREKPSEHMHEYSEANLAFHQTLIHLSDCRPLVEQTENLLIHVRAIRKVTIHQDNRAERSIVDHMNIIDALRQRDTERAERLVRDHTLGLAAHVEAHGDFLDLAG